MSHSSSRGSHGGHGGKLITKLAAVLVTIFALGVLLTSGMFLPVITSKKMSQEWAFCYFVNALLALFQLIFTAIYQGNYIKLLVWVILEGIFAVGVLACTIVIVYKSEEAGLFEGNSLMKSDEKGAMYCIVIAGFIDAVGTFIMIMLAQFL